MKKSTRPGGPSPFSFKLDFLDAERRERLPVKAPARLGVPDRNRVLLLELIGAALDQFHAIAVRVRHERDQRPSLSNGVRRPLGLDAVLGLQRL